MPTYGIGVYILDPADNLFLVKKSDSEQGKNGQEWLVPGCHLKEQNKTWLQLTDSEQKKVLSDVLKNETPLGLSDAGIKMGYKLCKWLGGWPYRKDNKKIFFYDNLIIKAEEEFVEFGELTPNKLGIDILEARSFRITELPVDVMSDLTKEFFIGALYTCKTWIIQSREKKFEEEFKENLGYNSKKYIFLGDLGGGGFGQVSKVLDISTLQCRVVKTPHPGDDRLDRFTEEGKALWTLIHKKVPGVEEVFSINRVRDERYYLVKGYVNGQDLQKCYKDIKREYVEQIIKDLVRTLSNVHKEGIAHRDVKPNNVMIESEKDSPPKVTLIDLGLAKDFGHPAALPGLQMTSSGPGPGNVLYQSVNTCVDYTNHTILDDYYGVLHIYYLLLKQNHFYAALHGMHIDKKNELLKVKTAVETAKRKELRDPFLECSSEAFEGDAKLDGEYRLFHDFHAIIKKAYETLFQVKDGKICSVFTVSVDEARQRVLNETTAEILKLWEIDRCT